jgi:hypothetical protein
LLNSKQPRAAGRPNRTAIPRSRLPRAALAVTALALAAAGAILIWSQAWLTFNPSHASLGGAAIRPATESYMTGPGIPLRPVASAMDSTSFNVAP